MSDKKNILVLCTGNACRSQLLHGYLQQALRDRATVHSAGVEVHGVNPRAVRVMAEDGVYISPGTLATKWKNRPPLPSTTTC